MRAFRDSDPSLRPGLRKEGAGAAVPDPEKLSYKISRQEPRSEPATALDQAIRDAEAEIVEQVDAQVYVHPAARHYGQPADEAPKRSLEEFDRPAGAVHLHVEVRLTEHAAGGEQSQRIVHHLVQQILDKAVREHAIRLHHEGEPARVAGMTVRRAS